MEQLISFNKLSTYLKRNLQFLYSKLGEITLNTTAGVLYNGVYTPGRVNYTTINDDKYYCFYTNSFQLQGEIELSLPKEIYDKTSLDYKKTKYVVQVCYYTNNTDISVNNAENDVKTILLKLSQSDEDVNVFKLTPKFYKDKKSFKQYYQRISVLCNCKKATDFPGIMRES